MTARSSCSRAPGIYTKSYASYVGAVNVTASSYGNSVSYTPEDQAFSAIDGNLDTAWITGTFVPDPAGQWWQARFTNPVTTDHITLVQPQRGDRSRWVSSVTLTFDGKDPVSYDLTERIPRHPGQILTFPTRTFHTLRVTIDGTTDDTATPLSASAVGFAEVEIPGQLVHQVRPDADPDAVRGRGLLGRRPLDVGDDPPAHLAVPAPDRPRDHDHAPVHAADRRARSRCRAAQACRP